MLKKTALFIMLVLLNGCDNKDKISENQQQNKQPEIRQVEPPSKKVSSPNSVDLNTLLEKRNAPLTNNQDSYTNESGTIQTSNNSYSDPIQTLNNLRAIYGLNRLYENRQLAFAAEKHAYYLKGQNQPSHYEESNQPNYFGKDPMERALKSEYSNTSFSVGEVLAFYDGERSNDIEKFLVAIYHRFLILEPKYNEVGSHYIKNGTTNIIEIMLGVRNDMSNNIQTSYYPYDNQIDIPLLFYPSQEIPNPMPEREIVGYPITFQISSGNKLDIVSFNLYDDKGNNLDGKIMNTSTDEHITESQFGFIPYNKFRENTKYTVNISGYINGSPFSKRWSFTTKKEPGISINVNKAVFYPNEIVNLKYSGVDTRSVNMMSKVIGSKTALVKVKEQSWGNITLDTLKGCELQEGCNVSLTLSDGEGKQKTIDIKVLP